MQKQPTPALRQVLLRLPEDLANRLSRAVAPRQRNLFLVNLVRQELDRQAQERDRELIAACEAMNALEAQDPQLQRETQEWLDAELTASVDEWDPDFDAETFEREAAIAQAALAQSQAAAK